MNLVSLRRRRRERFVPRDAREIVVAGGREMSCDFYKQIGPVPTMRAVDAMPKEYRALVHEFGIDVWSKWKAGLSVEAIRKAFRRG